MKIAFGSGSAAIFQPARFRGTARQQITNEMLQPLLFRGLKAQKLDADIILSDVANDRFDGDRSAVVGNLQTHNKHASFARLAVLSPKRAPAHRYVASDTVATALFRAEG